MRPTTLTQKQQARQVPRAWIIIAAAVASWMLFGAIAFGLSQIFFYVLS